MSNHDDEVGPRGPLEIPAATGISEGVSHHSPGFDETRAETEANEAAAMATPLTVELPPTAPDEVPRASLSERMSGQISAEERS